MLSMTHGFAGTLFRWSVLLNAQDSDTVWEGSS